MSIIQQNRCLCFLLALATFCFTCSEPDDHKITISDVTPEAAGIGEEVFIFGSGFGADIAVVKVFFNDKLALVKSVTDTLIITEVPENATTGEILVNVRDRSAKWSGIFNLVNGKWTRKADFPGEPRRFANAFALDGKGYVFGGGTIPGTTFSDMYAYDPVADRWEKKADSPFPIFRGATFTIGNKAYAGLTSFNHTQVDSVAMVSFYEYDPAEDKWTQRASFPGNASDFGLGFSINGKGYAGAGLGINLVNSDFCEYDPETDTWTKLSPPPMPTWSGTGFVIDNIFYFGFQHSRAKEFWKFDPVTQIWSRLKDLPFEPPIFQAGFAIGNRGYISSGGIMVWEYDPSTDSWAQKSAARGGLLTHAAAPFVIDNKAYLATGGGVTSEPSNACLEFDPE